jgi:hypothetical protein
MPTITLEQVNRNVLELRKEFEELRKSMRLETKQPIEEKGWNALAEKSLREVWDNKKDDKVWLKYL